jgi:hypothetical protein
MQATCFITTTIRTRVSLLSAQTVLAVALTYSIGFRSPSTRGTHVVIAPTADFHLEDGVQQEQVSILPRTRQPVA